VAIGPWLRVGMSHSIMLLRHSIGVALTAHSKRGLNPLKCVAECWVNLREIFIYIEHGTIGTTVLKFRTWWPFQSPNLANLSEVVSRLSIFLPRQFVDLVSEVMGYPNLSKSLDRVSIETHGDLGYPSLGNPHIYWYFMICALKLSAIVMFSWYVKDTRW